MAQSFIAGGTNYSEQSINDIKKDIEAWMLLCKRIKALFESTIAELKEQNYWDQNVAAFFKAFCYSVPQICDTFCSDFEIILSAISRDQITTREISLMRNIYRVSIENEEYSWKSFKGKEDGERWHDYGNPSFEKVEELYGRGRDFFVTLRDVSNAVARMEDYMKEDKTVIDNSIHTDNSITIGDGNKIKNSVVGNSNTVEKPQNNSSFWDRFGLPLIITIIGGVAVAAICIWLGLR